MDNPYQSPNSASDQQKVQRPSWLRGILYSAPLSIGAALIPLLLPVTYHLLALRFNWDIDHELFDDALILPSIGCGALFFAAGIRNYSPAQQTGMIPCLMSIGIFTIAGLVLMSVATLVFSLEACTYESDPWLPVRVLLAVSIPACYTICSTRKRMGVTLTQEEY